jgi:hypothetical protein
LTPGFATTYGPGHQRGNALMNRRIDTMARWACLVSVSLVLAAVVAPCASEALIIIGTSATAGPSSLTHSVVLVTNDDSNASVTQTVLVTDVDFMIPMGSVFGQYFADADIVTGSGSISLSGYVDTTNTTPPFGVNLHGAETLIGSANESTVPFTALVPLTLSAPYGLTLLLNFTLEPLSSLTFTHTVSVIPAVATVPTPATAILLSVGLFAAARKTLRRQQ